MWFDEFEVSISVHLRQNIYQKLCSLDLSFKDTGSLNYVRSGRVLSEKSVITSRWRCPDTRVTIKNTREVFVRLKFIELLLLTSPARPTKNSGNACQSRNMYYVTVGLSITAYGS